MNNFDQLIGRTATKAAQGTRTPSPIPIEQLQQAERLLGFPLHPLLAALYRHVADGGFGPQPLLPLIGEDPEDQESSAVGSYLGRTAPEAAGSWWSWPHRVLPIMDRGCNIVTCVDCQDTQGTVLLFDPHRTRDSLSRGWLVEADNLAEWLENWLAGRDRHRDHTADKASAMPPWADASSRLHSD
ncbi:hypothetical protein RVR_20 [Actinacidiphila reveromycinica]|uniref:Knr4/Smi1-like domain-containing protein n=1 Tax=Actinacidiphila reveromycinica TaxID=659352 RepID=A0A7U3VL73_9ACTN|nr:SMI1/KNR4 family protein [Streptomyces sp. SN-593]BBA95239.1 hypothetical protein RVR_20 [Streptomyces sp. SN-593]